MSNPKQAYAPMCAPDHRGLSSSGRSPSDRQLPGETMTLIDGRETARRLGISYITVRHLVMQRRIPHVKIGRRCLFDPRALERWIDERRVEPVVSEVRGRRDS